LLTDLACLAQNWSLLSKSDAVQSAYRAYGEDARSIGVFGSPTYVIEAERFWGQDRLDFVEAYLKKLKHD